MTWNKLIRTFKVMLNKRFWVISINRWLYWRAYDLDKSRPCAICRPPWIYYSYDTIKWSCHPLARHSYRVWDMTEEEIASKKLSFQEKSIQE